MSEVIRIFVEKKDGFNVLAKQTLWDIRHNLGMKSVEDLRYIVRYDLEGLTKEEYDKAKTIVLSEPNADVIYEETLPVEDGWKVFAMEYLPGQYDQRGDSAEQCVQLLTQGERCKVLTARVIALKGNITDEELVKVEEYLINPVESRLASLEKPKTLDMEIPVPENVKRVEGFNGWNDDEMQKYYDSMGFAMTLADLKFCRDYFRDTEHRDPSVTELRVIDTYWSDHCRHTTFLTRLEEIEIEKSALGKVIEDALSEYYATRDEVYGKDTKRIVSLMDMALIGMKSLKKKGLIPDLDESEEINACSIQVPVTIDGKQNSGSFSSRTKLTTTRQKSSLSVVPQPVLAVQSVIRFQAVHMYIRLCVLQARAIRQFLSRIQCTASSLHAKLQQVPLRVTAHTVTRLVLQQVR